MWSSLLTKRPRTKDPKKLSSWLNEVLAVSDMDFPLDQVGTTELMDDSLGSTLLLNHLPNLSQINSDTTVTATGTSSTTTEDVEKLTKRGNSSRTTAATTLKNKSSSSIARTSNSDSNSSISISS